MFFLHQTAFASAARFHYPPSCCKMFWIACFGLLWTFGEFDWIKEKIFQQIYSRCGDTWIFACFLTCNIRFLLLKQKKNQTDLIFFCFSNKKLRKKVAKQKNLTWGHAETFICDCNIFHFLLPSHKKCFRVPLASKDALNQS